LDFSSHHEIKHNISTASAAMKEKRGTNHFRAALEANVCPSAVISNILNRKPLSGAVSPPEELVFMFFKWAEPSDTYKDFACLPYIRGLTESLTRLLRNDEICVVNKPFKALQ